jgi:protein involved in polysaccharide export with SLBB domain
MKRSLPLILVLLLGGAALDPARGQAPGTFRVGDRVWLQVDGEQQLSDTFTVAPGLVLNLPAIGAVSLDGVPRARVEAHLAGAIGRYLLRPVVRARALIRIAIAGQVARPGFYAVPTDLVLPDAVMLAGGATPDAKLAGMRVERGRRRLVGPAQVERAVAQGLSLDDLDLRAGDRLVVPGRGGGFESAVRTFGILASIPVAVYAVTQLF